MLLITPSPRGFRDPNLPAMFLVVYSDVVTCECSMFRMKDDFDENALQNLIDVYNSETKNCPEKFVQVSYRPGCSPAIEHFLRTRWPDLANSSQGMTSLIVCVMSVFNIHSASIQ